MLYSVIRAPVSNTYMKLDLKLLLSCLSIGVEMLGRLGYITSQKFLFPWEETDFRFGHTSPPIMQKSVPTLCYIIIILQPAMAIILKYYLIILMQYLICLVLLAIASYIAIH